MCSYKGMVGRVVLNSRDRQGELRLLDFTHLHNTLHNKLYPRGPVEM